MPLYAITTQGSDKVRLVDASSEAAALKHAASGMFAARRVSKPAEVATLVKAGATMETAGEAPEDSPEDAAKNAEASLAAAEAEREAQVAAARDAEAAKGAAKK